MKKYTQRDFLEFTHLGSDGDRLQAQISIQSLSHGHKDPFAGAVETLIYSEIGSKSSRRGLDLHEQGAVCDYGVHITDLLNTIHSYIHSINIYSLTPTLCQVLCLLIGEKASDQ